MAARSFGVDTSQPSARPDDPGVATNDAQGSKLAGDRDPANGRNRHYPAVGSSDL